MSSNEEHYKSELQQVIGNKVTTNSRSCVDPIDIAGEKVCDVADLEDEEGNPDSGQQVLQASKIRQV